MLVGFSGAHLSTYFTSSASPSTSLDSQQVFVTRLTKHHEPWRCIKLCCFSFLLLCRSSRHPTGSTCPRGRQKLCPWSFKINLKGLLGNQTGKVSRAATPNHLRCHTFLLGLASVSLCEIMGSLRVTRTEGSKQLETANKG